MKEYKEFQFGWTGVPVTTFTLVFAMVMYSIGAGSRPVPGVGLAILVGTTALVLMLFYGMTTTIDTEKITISFGIGLIRKRIAIQKIKDIELIKNPWYYGWGIRFIPNGMLYNISGSNGVEIRFHDTGRIIRIGTKASANLKEEIESRLAK